MSLPTALVITKSSLSPGWISCSKITLVTADLWHYCTKHRCPYIGSNHNKWHHVNTTLTQSHHKDNEGSEMFALVLCHSPCERHSILAVTTHHFFLKNGKREAHTMLGQCAEGNVSRQTHWKGGRVQRVMMWVQPSATATLNGTASNTAASTSLCPLHQPNQLVSAATIC